MKLFNPVILAVILFYSGLGFTNSTLNEKAEEVKVLYLLDKIEKSNATFVRNGTSHTAKKARKHLEMKYNKAKSRFFFIPVKVTAKKFIDKIASKSSLSGKDYLIILPNKQKFKAGDWLHKELKIFLSKQNKQSQN